MELGTQWIQVGVRQWLSDERPVDDVLVLARR
jgi:hypothetical protein